MVRSSDSDAAIDRSPIRAEDVDVQTIIGRTIGFFRLVAKAIKP